MYCPECKRSDLGPDDFYWFNQKRKDQTYKSHSSYCIPCNQYINRRANHLRKLRRHQALEEARKLKQHERHAQPSGIPIFNPAWLKA